MPYEPGRYGLQRNATVGKRNRLRGPTAVLGDADRAATEAVVPGERGRGLACRDCGIDRARLRSGVVPIEAGRVDHAARTVEAHGRLRPDDLQSRNCLAQVDVGGAAVLAHVSVGRYELDVD